MIALYKCCSRCGKIHTKNYTCHDGKRIYVGGSERQLRSTWRWTEKSRDIRERAHYLCEVCKAEGRLTYDDIEVHHIVPLSEWNEGLLEDSNLVCLCVDHHKQADRGEISREALKILATQRDSGLIGKKKDTPRPKE